MNRRRRLVLAQGVCLTGNAATLLCLPAIAAAQSRTLPVIGFLGTTAQTPQLVASFVQGLAAAGFIDGHNVAIQYRWADSQPERLAALAAELVRAKPTVIVTIGGTPAAHAVKRATSTVPIVFEVGRDPVETGVVASLGHPGGNATGVYIVTGELNAKRLELLHEMVPRAVTIATLINSANPIAQSIENEVAAAARTTGLSSLVVRAHSEEEIVTAFVMFAKQSEALIVSNDSYFNTKRELLIALTARHSLPAIFEWREFTALGGLMSYGTSLAGAMRELGARVAKILNGAKPADLPVTQSSRFELVINRKTATALRLSIPPSLLARADEVIE